MTQTVASSSSRRRHVREPPSIPFLWEHRPGVAKKDWKPPLSPINTPALPSPVKLFASVPFIWEEKPGKPLPYFSDPPPPANLLALTWPDEQQNSELESLSFETDDSFGSTHSLSANCLVPTSAISAAVPAVEIPSSPASDSDDGSSTSSYATGVSSLTGSSFLECLFPLYARNSSFSGDGGIGGPKGRDFDDDGDDVARRTVTLGELIMMSRRKSYQRKAVNLPKQNFSMEFINKKVLGCCIFGAGINMLEGLHRKKQHLLKLL